MRVCEKSRILGNQALDRSLTAGDYWLAAAAGSARNGDGDQGDLRPSPRPGTRCQRLYLIISWVMQ